MFYFCLMDLLGGLGGEEALTPGVLVGVGVIFLFEQHPPEVLVRAELVNVVCF